MRSLTDELEGRLDDASGIEAEMVEQELGVPVGAKPGTPRIFIGTG